MIVPVFAEARRLVFAVWVSVKCKKRGKHRERRIVILAPIGFPQGRSVIKPRKRPVLRAVLLGFLFASGFLGRASIAYAQEQFPAEYRIKAQYLANFAKFVEWPEESFAAGDGAFVIGVLGNYRFGISLSEAVSGKTVQGRKIKIRLLKPEDNLRECQIVFIGASARDRVAKTLTSLQRASVLAVGETEGFLEAGGTINFLVEQDRVRFEINLGSAKQARLKVSSQLLAVARNIRGDPRVPKT